MPTLDGMDFYFFVQVAAAVVVGNAASFAFFMGAMKMSRLQSQGVKEEDLPVWTWFALMPAPAMLALGAALL